jgi:hypothetical protein
MIFLDSNKKDDSNEFLAGGISINIVAYYSVIFAAYICSWKFQHFIWWLLGIDISLLFLVFIIKIFTSEKSSKK